MKLAPVVLSSDVERFVVEAGGRRAEGRGELQLQSRFLQMNEEGAAPFSLQLQSGSQDQDGLEGSQDVFFCAWVEGSRELQLGKARQPPCFVLLVHEAGADVGAIARQLGAAVLRSAAEPPAAVQLAASAIEGTGKIMAAMLTGGAGVFGAGFGAALQSFRTNVTPGAEPMRVSPTANSLIDTTSSAAKAAEDFTGGVRSGLTAVAVSVGSSAAESLTQKSSLAGPGSGVFGSSAVALGGASAAALGEVYTALEISTQTVLGAASTAASGAIGHRYGSEAEAAAATVGGSVQNITRSAFNISSFGVRSLAKATAKQTVKGVGSQLNEARVPSVPPAPLP
ncbi:senescence-associated protein-domain-containing protein [Pavlovales sp. CCMP2436]|nr:senescence-associated protein-domain-containing protein [Pavlovales sp. CCMP2436]